MRKLTIVINGSGGVGKDTLCKLMAKHYRVMNVSSIDPIKRIALENGWDGEKSEKSRKFLADLKQLFVEFNDLPQKYLEEKYREFLDSEEEILFVHIREPEEIEKFVSKVPGRCVTLLVRGDAERQQEWNNQADDEVEHYRYDYIYENKMSLADAEADFLSLFRQILKENE